MQKQKTEEQFGTDFLVSGSAYSLFSNASFIRELDTPYGRPDVVLFDTKPNSRRAILSAMKDSPSTVAFAAVYFTLKANSNKLDFRELKKQTNMSDSSIRHVIKAMSANNLLTLGRAGYSLSPRANIPQTNIISIEFKLHDWRKALQQALRHLAFADRAYVIMPMRKKTLLNKNIEVFKDFGVSVAVFDDETKEFEVLLESSEKSVYEVPYLDTVSRIWINREMIGQI